MTEKDQGESALGAAELMANPGHDLARAYFAAVTAGELPDSLLTEDMTAWLTTEGAKSKAEYQEAVRLLARMCAEPIQFTVDAITAEDDRVVAEARSQARLINGEPYAMTYVFSFRIRGGRIAWIAEHYNALIAQQKLFPLMAQLA
jgi:ketosteroid isomerase-like protein